MFIETDSGLLNLDRVHHVGFRHVKGTNQTVTTFYDDEDRRVAERVTYAQYEKEEIELLLTSTLVPVVGAGFTVISAYKDDDGAVKIYEREIIAFRVRAGYGVPVPVLIDDDLFQETADIKMPDGRVLIPYDTECENVEAYRQEKATKLLEADAA